MLIEPQKLNLVQKSCVFPIELAVVFVYLCISLLCFATLLLFWCGRDGENINLGSFLFRDDCYNLLTKLVNVSSSISRLNGEPALSTGIPSPSSAGGSSFALDHEPSRPDTPPEPLESAPGVAITRPLVSASHPCDVAFETMLDAVLPCTTAQVIHP